MYIYIYIYMYINISLYSFICIGRALGLCILPGAWAGTPSFSQEPNSSVRACW